MRAAPRWARWSRSSEGRGALPGSRDQAAEGPPQDEKDDDVLGPGQRTREADQAAHQIGAHQGLSSGAYADTGRDRDGSERRRRGSGIEGDPDIDQNRPEPDTGPRPRPPHQDPGQREARWGPDGRRIAWGDGQ